MRLVFQKVYKITAIIQPMLLQKQASTIWGLCFQVWLTPPLSIRENKKMTAIGSAS
jgi:hypothetical protein